ncbi:MAG TPA: formate--tetrahydrofolate ligase [Jiangellaceae bacterium]
MPPDIEISRDAVLRPLDEIAAQIGIGQHLLEPYGRAAAKISLDAISELGEPRAKYVVVTAVTPTRFGEGKTTTTVGLGQAFGQLHRSAVVAIRQPSMGPTFGIKGGAAGGGYAQVAPMETLNLHLTGDMHAVTAAHNLLAAVVDNHLYQGNELGLDPQSISWRRVLDVNDRSLRSIVTGLGGRVDGIPRQTGFDITAASEVMAVLALSRDLADLRARLGRIIVGTTRDGEPVTAEDLKAAGAMCVMLLDALKPNLMQTIEQTPVLVHCGPFGNIAHGNSSVVADLIGTRSADYVITEAGFGADMGAERFFNIKCRTSGLVPDAAVVVATAQSLKVNGAENLRKHIENVQRHGVTPVVAVNAFDSDDPDDRQEILDVSASMGARAAVCRHYAEGGKGAVELAEAVAEACEEPSEFGFLYPDDMPLFNKIETVAREMYGADGIDLAPAAEKSLAECERLGFGEFPVCIAKTHQSLTADPTRTGAPTGWRLPVREVRACAGAGFIYPLAGEMRTMPGLSSAPAVERIDIDEAGQIVGLS